MHYHTVHRYTYSGYVPQSFLRKAMFRNNGLDVQSCLLNTYYYLNGRCDTTNPDSYREVCVHLPDKVRLHPADHRYCPGPGLVNSDQGKELAYRVSQFPELHS